MSGTDAHLNRVMLRMAALGALVTLGSLYFRSVAITGGAAAGAALAVLNFWAQRRLVTRMLSERRKGGAAVLFLVKLGVIFGALYLLIAVAGLNALAMMAGFSVLVVAITLSGQAPADDGPADGVESLDG